MDMNSTIKCDGQTDIRMRKDKRYVHLHFMLCGEGWGSVGMGLGHKNK